MKEKRYLTKDELHRIRNEREMLDGNINRMCVSEDTKELVEMCKFATVRIQKILEICLNKFIDEEGEEN